MSSPDSTFQTVSRSRRRDEPAGAAGKRKLRAKWLGQAAATPGARLCPFGPATTPPRTPLQSLWTVSAQRAVDLAERAADARAERGHDRDAGDEDEGEHDCVLDCGRAVFAHQEPANLRFQSRHV